MKPENFYKAFQEYNSLAHAVKRYLDVVVLNSESSAKEKDLKKLLGQDNNNQKLGLLTELIKLNCWECVKPILNRFEGKVVLNSYPGMVEALCGLLE